MNIDLLSTLGADLLSALSADFLSTLLQSLVSVLFGAVGAWAGLGFFRRKERRLFKNVQRPIGIVGTPDMSMHHEATLLRRARLFNIDDVSSDARAADIIDDKRLVIIGYTPNSDTFMSVFEAAKNRSVPVIIYSKPGAITQEDLAVIQGYSLHALCNTPLRLSSDVFALMSTYPEDK